jgi:hypothetical protein
MSVQFTTKFPAIVYINIHIKLNLIYSIFLSIFIYHSSPAISFLQQIYEII